MKSGPNVEKSDAAVMKEQEAKLTPKQFFMNILNGLALGTVIVLIPGALLGELFRALLPVFPAGEMILNATSLSNSMMGFACGFIVGLVFKFTPIQSTSLGLAAMFAGGAASFVDGGIALASTGDIINMGIAASIGVLIVLFFQNKLVDYHLLIIPTLVLLVAGGIGVFTLPYVVQINTLVGSFIMQLLDFQPLLMSILISMVFAFLIVSPLTTVGIAVAISLAGIGSAAANLGIVATSFSLAIAGWKVNPVGTGIVHILGSPKISMPVAIAKPLTMVPVFANAAVTGAFAAIFGLEGTPMSAGFGISGLIGPINAINLTADGWTLQNILIVTLVFVVVPIVFGFIFNYIFTKVWPIVKPEDYKIIVN